MKKILSLFALLTILTASSMAVSDSIIIKVTPTGTKGVSIDATQYNFGTQSLGTQNILSTSTINVENTGNISSTWNIKVNPTSTAWSPGANSGTNQYHMGLIFNSVAPASGDFVNGSDDVLATDKPCGGSDFAGDQNCVAVPPAGIRKMWLSLDMPGSSSSEVEQQFSIEVTAS